MTETSAATAQEIEATTEYVDAEINGQAFRVKVATKWRPSYFRALRSADFDTWAEGVIHPDDLEAWTEADPTFEEISKFATSAMSATGEDPGKYSGPSRSSTRSRRK